MHPSKLYARNLPRYFRVWIEEQLRLSGSPVEARRVEHHARHEDERRRAVHKDVHFELHVGFDAGDAMAGERCLRVLSDGSDHCFGPPLSDFAKDERKNEFVAEIVLAQISEHKEAFCRALHGGKPVFAGGMAGSKDVAGAFAAQSHAMRLEGTAKELKGRLVQASVGVEDARKPLRIDDFHSMPCASKFFVDVPGRVVRR